MLFLSSELKMDIPMCHPNTRVMYAWENGLIPKGMSTNCNARESPVDCRQGHT